MKLLCKKIPRYQPFGDVYAHWGVTTTPLHFYCPTESIQIFLHKVYPFVDIASSWYDTITSFSFTFPIDSGHIKKPKEPPLFVCSLPFVQYIHPCHFYFHYCIKPDWITFMSPWQSTISHDLIYLYNMSSSTSSARQ